MVWKLADLCLQCVQQNLEKYPDIGSSLPTQYKEILIERLSCHDKFYTESIKHNNLFSSRLRHLNLESSYLVTDSLLQQLGNAGCILETLTLKRLDNVTDVGVQAVTSGQHALCVVHLMFLQQITQNVLSSITSTELVSFMLRKKSHANKPWCTQANLAGFFSRNPSIKYLRLDIDIEMLPTVARGLGSSLKELETNFQSVNDEKIEILAQHCPNMEKLDLNGAKYVGKEALIKLFQACTLMSNLDLGYCSRIALAPENEVLWTLPQGLTTLSLCGLMLEDKEILVECLTRLTQIRSLKLCGVPALDDDSLTRIVKKIGHQLTSLNLSGVGMKEATDEGLKSVAEHCTNLQSFHISLLRNVTGLTIKPIFTDPVRARKIQALSINSKQMDESVLDLVISSCPNLDILDMSGLTFVNDARIIILADHSPRLTQLYLKSCKHITDAAICYLSGNCPLRSLGLSGLHALTDKSIFCLASSCPQMEEIFLNGCANISPMAVQYLKDSCLRWLNVKHHVPNASPNQLMARNLDTGEFCRADLL